MPEITWVKIRNPNYPQAEGRRELFEADIDIYAKEILRMRETLNQIRAHQFAWFHDVLLRIAAHPITRLDELLPHRWTPSRA
jgi:hypothetical protein